MRLLVALAAAVLAAAPAAAETSAGSTADIVLRRMAAEALGPAQGGPRSRTVARLIASQRPDGSWPGIPYGDHSRSIWLPMAHLANVLALARAWRRDPGDTAALAAATRGLEYWERTDPYSDNWWWQTIGMQQQLAPVLLLLKGAIPAPDFQAGCRMLARSHVDRMTGTNLAWEAGNRFALGALTGNEALMREMLALIVSVDRVTTAEGLQPDWSYHQHGPQLNAGNYGLGFVETCAHYGAYVEGTPLQLPPAKVALLAGFLEHFQDWAVWGQDMDLSNCGRQLDSPGAQPQKARVVAQNARLVLRLDPPGAAALKSLVERVEGRLPPAADAPRGLRVYWRSDYLIDRPGSWFASVKMYSPRVLRTETAVNSENYRGYHLSDGATFLLVRGDEYEDIQPVWDWRRLPGVTFRDTAEPFPYGGKAPAQHNPEPFVGGVSDGRNGLAAMDISKQDVHARKAWFFFPGGLVALGCDLRSSGPGDLTTSINQCLQHGPVEILLPGGWLFVASTRPRALIPAVQAVRHDGVGYVLLQPGRAILSAGVQTGSWALLRKEGVSPAVVAKDVFALWIDHGPNPAGAGYAYAVLPGASEEALAGFAQNPTYRILSNSSDLQAVWSPSDRLLEAAFHRAGGLRLSQAGITVSVDAPCLLLIDWGRDSPHWSVADPTQRRSMLAVTINGRRSAVPLPSGGFAGSTVTRSLE